MKKKIFWIAAVIVLLTTAVIEYRAYEPIYQAGHRFFTSPSFYFVGISGESVTFKDNNAVGMKARIFYDHSWKEMCRRYQARDIASFYIPHVVLHTGGTYEIKATDRDGYTGSGTIYVLEGVIDEKPFN